MDNQPKDILTTQETQKQDDKDILTGENKDVEPGCFTSNYTKENVAI